MAVKMLPLLLLGLVCVSLLTTRGSGALCPRGEDDHLSLCAMCSDNHAAVRWNRSDSVHQIEVEYTCKNATTEVQNSDHDPCNNKHPPLSELFSGVEFFSGVVTIGAEIATGVRCDFNVIYGVTGKAYRYRANTNCTIRSTETCETSPEECHLDQVCSMSEGDTCPECDCAPGYSGEECTNIDECSLGVDLCVQNAECVDTEGNYTCVCSNGYSGDGLWSCANINECESNSTCHEQAECYDTEGSYLCECRTGYEGDGYNVCIDVDECDTNNYTCPEASNCSNTNGSYECECWTGYREIQNEDGFSCPDIDECVSSDNACHEHAQCTNSEGSFSCECMEGYLGDSYSNCSDIDECGLTEGPCHEDAECTNTEGSYECECRTGYEGDGYQCTDIDECKTNYTCPEASNCNNTYGSYECMCWAGYHQVQDSDGFYCLDIDECGTTNYTCPEASNCSNTNGSPLPHSTNIPAVVSGVVVGALLLVLLLVALAFLCLRGRSNKLPFDEMIAKNVDQFYTPNFSSRTGSLNSIHSEYEKLQYHLTLMEQKSSEQLSSSNTSNTTEPSPPPMDSALSSEQGASGSSKCSSMPASDYHEVDGVAVSKELEQKQLPTSTLSDTIPTMEEDTSLTAVEQALHEAYVPDDCPAPITFSSSPTILPHSSEAGNVQPLETKAASNSQPHTLLGISSADPSLGDLLSESPLENWFAPQYMTNSSDIHNSKASEVSDAEYNSYEMETEDIAQEWYGNSPMQSEDIPSTENYEHTSAEHFIQLNGYVHQHAYDTDFILNKEY